MSSDLKLFIDFAGNQLLTGVTANPTGSRPRFTLGDTLTVDLHLVELTGDSAFPADEISTDELAGASSSTTLALGALETLPTSGTFSLTYGANSTSPLAYNASAAQVSTALNALASVVSAGGVAVAQVGEGYRISFNSAGVRSAISATTDSLVPRSSAIVVESTVGTVSASSVQVVRLRANPVALVNSWSPLPTASATLSTVRTWDGINSTVRLTIADATGGSFNLGFTKAGPSTVYSAPLLPYDLSAADLLNALRTWSEFAVDGAASVRQIAVGVFDITSTVPPEAGSPVDGWAVDGSGLDSSVGLRGSLSLATVEAETTLDGADAVELILEVQVSAAGGAARTVLQIPASLVEDIIESAPCVPLEGDICLGADEAAAIYATKAEAPTANELAALHAASAPSAANPIATLADLASGGLALPANTRLALLGGASPSAANPFLTESAGDAAFLNQADNLSDLPSPATARTNLGLGTAATEDAADFALTANNLSDLADAATARTNLGLGTAATADAADFAATANNLSDLASASAARTNLGLGTAATEDATDFAQVANNLSDLADASTARTNLGLGTDATGSNLSALTDVATARANLGLGSDATGSNLSSLTDPAVARANLGIVNANLAEPNIVRFECPDFWTAHHSGAGTLVTVSPGVRYLQGPNASTNGHAFGYSNIDPIYSRIRGSFNFGNALRVSGKCQTPSLAEGYVQGTTFRFVLGLEPAQATTTGSAIVSNQNLVGFSWGWSFSGGPINIVTGNAMGGIVESASATHYAFPTLFDSSGKLAFSWELILDPTAGTLKLLIDGTEVHSVTAPTGFSGGVGGGSGQTIREEIECNGTNPNQAIVWFSTRVVSCS